MKGIVAGLVLGAVFAEALIMGLYFAGLHLPLIAALLIGSLFGCAGVLYAGSRWA